MRASLALNYKLCVELYLASWVLLFLLLLNIKKMPNSGDSMGESALP